jgi:acetylornithine deacetylase
MRGLQWSVEPLFAPIPPAETPADSAIVCACEVLSGHAAEAVSFGTEAPFFNQLGMDTVIFGPGDIAQAHQPDEYLALERIPPMLDILQRLIKQFCCSV